jgi:hypothetical protein
LFTSARVHRVAWTDISLLLVHPAQGPLVTTRWPSALKATEPPQRTETELALPVMSAVLPMSLVVTVLKFPDMPLAELLLVALTKL